MTTSDFNQEGEEDYWDTHTDWGTGKLEDEPYWQDD
jgi:hypothetical protein